MHVSSIQLRNWKNFQRAEARLATRVFVIGPNASGKSNFLDALRFLRDVADVGLSAAVKFRDGVSSIRCLAARASPDIVVDVTLTEGEEVAWQYRIEFRQDTTKTPVLRREIVRNLRGQNVVLDRPDADDRADELRLTQTALEQIVANQAFREVADFLKSISYQHLVPQVVRDPRGFSGKQTQNDPYGRDLLQRVWATPVKTRAAWLTRIGKVLRQAVPQLHELTVEQDDHGTPHLIGRYEHWRAHGAKHTEAQFSDGTLRLFGLMWSMFEGAGPLLLEEPELSLHPEVVRVLPQLLARLQREIRDMKRRAGNGARQVLISTHSETMLRDLGIEADEVLRIEPSSEGSVLVAAAEPDKALLRQGLTPGEVFLPRTAPGTGQLELEF